MTVKII